MEYILLGLLTAIAKTAVIVKILGWGRTVRLQIPLDIFFAFILPIIVGFGTITGALVTVMSGLWFTFIVFIASCFVKPQPLFAKKVT